MREMNMLIKKTKRKNNYKFAFREGNVIGGGNEKIKRVSELFKLIRANKNNIQLSFVCRIDDVTNQLLMCIKDSIFCIELGVEAFKDETLRFYNKNYTYDIIAKAFNALSRAKMNNVVFVFDMMLFHPYITLNILKQEVKLMQRHLFSFRIADRRPNFLFGTCLGLFEGQPALKQIQKEHPELLRVKEGDELCAEYDYDFLDKRVSMIKEDIVACLNASERYWAMRNKVRTGTLRELFEFSDCICDAKLIMPKINRAKSAWIEKRGLKTIECCINSYESKSIDASQKKAQHLKALKRLLLLQDELRFYYCQKEYKVFSLESEDKKIIFGPESGYLMMIARPKLKNIIKKITKGRALIPKENYLIPELNFRTFNLLTLGTVIIDMGSSQALSVMSMVEILHFIFQQHLLNNFDIHIKTDCVDDILTFEAALDEVLRESKIELQIVINTFIFWSGDLEDLAFFKKNAKYRHMYVLDFLSVANTHGKTFRSADILLNVQIKDMTKANVVLLERMLSNKKVRLYFGLELCGMLYDCSNMTYSSYLWSLFSRFSEKNVDKIWNFEPVKERQRAKLFHCKPGKEIIYIMSSGDIYPCHMLLGKQHKIGNVFNARILNQGLIELYEEYYVNNYEK